MPRLVTAIAPPDAAGLGAWKSVLQDKENYYHEENEDQANSVCFQDIYAKPIQAASVRLPSEAIIAAQTRGRALHIWETVGKLIESTGLYPLE